MGHFLLKWTPVEKSVFQYCIMLNDSALCWLSEWVIETFSLKNDRGGSFDPILCPPPPPWWWWHLNIIMRKLFFFSLLQNIPTSRRPKLETSLPRTPEAVIAVKCFTYWGKALLCFLLWFCSAHWTDYLTIRLSLRSDWPHQSAFINFTNSMVLRNDPKTFHFS